ncbi:MULTISPECIES: hypothetical protein [Rhodoplanes]|uniref:hypothetical protein n=1 Tax=Rhodoplanes TaxID=29407 RepID=UPI00101DF7F1|nr:hypothetical protein [Rhodoplanes serenus]
MIIVFGYASLPSHAPSAAEASQAALRRPPFLAAPRLCTINACAQDGITCNPRWTHDDTSHIVPVLAKMAARRRAGYKAIGYDITDANDLFAVSAGGSPAADGDGSRETAGRDLLDRLPIE